MFLRNALLIVCLLLIIAILTINYEWAWKLGDNKGVFGDLFGFSNALFSGCAFVGIIYTIFLQSEELSLQRKELSETRNEFVQQNATLKQQAFENTFFKLLEFQNNIRQAISTTPISESFEREQNVNIHSKWHELHLRHIVTRNLFKDENFASAFSRQKTYDTYERFVEAHYNQYDLNPDVGTQILGYVAFFRKQEDLLGNYFRHIYKILCYIYEQEIFERKSGKKIEEIREKYFQYADFIQAQMSAYELSLYFYNCLVFPKAKQLALYYHMLDNVSRSKIYDMRDWDAYNKTETFDDIQIGPLTA